VFQPNIHCLWPLLPIPCPSPIPRVHLPPLLSFTYTLSWPQLTTPLIGQTLLSTMAPGQKPGPSKWDGSLLTFLGSQLPMPTPLLLNVPRIHPPCLWTWSPMPPAKHLPHPPLLLFILVQQLLLPSNLLQLLPWMWTSQWTQLQNAVQPHLAATEATRSTMILFFHQGQGCLRCNGYPMPMLHGVPYHHLPS